MDGMNKKTTTVGTVGIVFSPTGGPLHSGAIKDFSWNNGGFICVEFNDGIQYYTGVNNVVIRRYVKED